ncbi:hypothetical protein GCM10010329_40900 [Streptomyces spiroverticillatus]|uniref:Ankyrin n=1 Tax=Streptomyces finlayi TaxID=67296 RepID=A0A919CAR6_9ACTN|nr:hypothetical protein [Streptomyces finlayi]GHA13844.1 hypothetical protein GCM10010329_40900 [Streptomyces spiroverticillatus]GHC97696.1 hypothetical protein GCM10010334_39340 [Streptomyces finlayi]
MYESHLTVLCHGEELRRLERWAAARTHRVKFTHIALDRGRSPDQPMLTLRGTRPTYAAEIAAARRTTAQLTDAGFTVARWKVECAPWATEVPQDDLGAATAGPDAGPGTGRHFEHHIKLLLPLSYDHNALVTHAERHGAHVSRNARRRRSDGRQERFVTQRCHGVGNDRAAHALTTLLAELTPYEVIDVEREYVLLDSASPARTWTTRSATSNGTTSPTSTPPSPPASRSSSTACAGP